jgi:outer membrane biosynthesis protein TonB
MSLATAQPRPAARSGRFAIGEGVARRGLALSGMLHLVLIALLIFGLPALFSPPAPQEMPIAVDLVNLAPETRASHPNPSAPQHQAKPVEPVPGPAAQKPPPKPQPPQPAPSAAAAPNPEPPVPPEAKPAPPPLPQAKPVPPPNPVAEAAPQRPSEKPQPPKVKSASAARAEARKYDPGQFDALLRNLAAADNAVSSEAAPRRSPAAGRPSSQPQAPLGRLSASEIDMVREQISRCWNIPAGAREARDLVVVIRVAVSPDGNVEAATIVDQGRAAGDPSFRAAAESARRAFFNPLCRPLRLPADKYQIWRDMVVDFSPKDLS